MSPLTPGLIMRPAAPSSPGALPYVLYLPPELATLKPGEKIPLILFLHGSGESGTDGLKSAAQGLPRHLLFTRSRWPAVIIMPQKPEERLLWDKYSTQVFSILDSVRAEFPIDDSRIYLTGLSQGGYGTWALAAQRPDTFAALAPVCGWVSDDSILPKVAHIPVWAFHGGADDVVKPEGTTKPIAALQALGAHAQMTVYPGVNHNSWDSAYSDEKLAQWMFSQRRPAAR